MSINSVKELEEEASKKALEFMEDFVKKQGSMLIPSGVGVFEQLRPFLEGSYSYGYQHGYTNALCRAMEDTRSPGVSKGDSRTGARMTPEEETKYLNDLAGSWANQEDELPSIVEKQTLLSLVSAAWNKALAAERERCVKAICAGCDEGKETKTIDGSLVHLWDDWKNLFPCEAELIREP